MAPPTAGYRLVRDAVLSLSLSQEFVRPLYHWRTSRPHAYLNSALNCAGDDNLLFRTGPAAGAPPKNIRLAQDQSELFLTKLSLLCAQHMGDEAQFEQLIQIALQDLQA